MPISEKWACFFDWKDTPFARSPSITLCALRQVAASPLLW